MKHCIFVLCFAALCTAAFSERLTFSEKQSIDYTPHPNVGNPYALITRAAGPGVVFTDAYVDAFMRCATPLTSNGTDDNAANTWQVCRDTDYGGSFGSGESFQGVTYDGTAYYACGIKGAAGCQLVRAVDSGNDTTRWTGVMLTLSADGLYSGVTAVGPNNVVMPNYDTGALQFFTVAGNNATANGAPVANPSATGFKTTQAFYYDSGTTKYIFVYMVNDTTTRRIDYFTTNGTPAGTTYVGTFAAGLTSDMPAAGHYKQKWGNLNIDPVSKIMVAAVNAGNTDGNLNGFDAFDLATIAANQTAYMQVRGGDIAVPGSKNVAGLAFFTVTPNKYLAVTHGNHLTIYNAVTLTGVKDWTLYE